MIIEKGVILTKEAAIALFCNNSDGALQVISEWNRKITSENHDEYYSDLRSMVLITKTYHQFKSEKVCIVIQAGIEKILHQIFGNNQNAISLKSLRFFYSIIWAHRNIPNLNALKSYNYSKELICNIREQISSVSKTRQLELFNA